MSFPIKSGWIRILMFTMDRRKELKDAKSEQQKIFNPKIQCWRSGSVSFRPPESGLHIISQNYGQSKKKS